MQVRSLCRIILLLLAWLPASLWAREDLASVREQVAAFLDDHYLQSGYLRHEIRVGNLDPRLNLPACQQPLSLTLRDTSNTGGQVSVHTRCPEPVWGLYVPSQVALFAPVVVAAGSLERGSILTESDLALEVVNISSLRQGYLDDLGQALGRELRRPVARGEALRSALLDAPMLVRRGDAVVMEAQSGAISVVSSGIALSNGREGQQIRVRSHSDRIVSGQVVAEGRVRTLN